MINNKIAVIGGDKRMLFAAKEFSEEGYEVFLAGFDRIESIGSIRLTDVFYALSVCDAVLLPVTGIRDGKIPCAFSDGDIDFKSIEKSLRDKLVFFGKSCGDLSGNTVDILADEDFLRDNALPTAEGALLEAMKNYEDDIAGSDILVIGCGRIGDRLSVLLRSVGARVTVSTRSVEKAGIILKNGNTPINTAGINSLNGYDIVFNTADARVVDKSVLESTTDDPLIIDLASYPGGVDFAAARELGFTAVHALALPGKYSPKSAGRAIFSAVNKRVKGENYV